MGDPHLGKLLLMTGHCFPAVLRRGWSSFMGFTSQQPLPPWNRAASISPMHRAQDSRGCDMRGWPGDSRAAADGICGFARSLERRSR